MHKSKKLPRSHDSMNESEGLKNSLQWYESPAGRVITFYLSGEIKESSLYSDWFQTIRTASETDIIYFRINSPGGDLFTAIQMMRAITESKAHIVSSVEGICMSAATMIFLAADTFEVSDHTMFMFHNYSSGIVGKGGEMYDQVVHTHQWSERLMHEIYKDFLTPAEIKAILDNKDIWMDSQEVVKRLESKATTEEKKPTRRTKKT